MVNFDEERASSIGGTTFDHLHCFQASSKSVILWRERNSCSHQGVYLVDLTLYIKPIRLYGTHKTSPGDLRSV